MSEKKTITVKEAAAMLDVSLPTMYDITEQESFYPLLRVGRKKLIVRSRFDEWLQEQTQPKQA